MLSKKRAATPPVMSGASKMGRSVGGLVWCAAVGAEEPYTLARVVREDGEAVIVELAGDEENRAAPLRVGPEQIRGVADAEQEYDVNDVVELRDLNYPNVLEALCRRFHAAARPSFAPAATNDVRWLLDHKAKIYTYAGWILICLNPFSETPGLYGEDVCEVYFKKALGSEVPHPFAIASAAFEKLIVEGTSQFIMVSGESGGGKTECTKHLLKYLTWVSRRTRRLRGRRSIADRPSDAADQLASLLIAANPILEFFGNAKTLRNTNSSRFGKLLRLFYSADGERLTSAELQTYLLAKSRVVDVPKNEENYHIFYALLHHPEVSRVLFHNPASFTSKFLGDGAIPALYSSDESTSEVPSGRSLGDTSSYRDCYLRENSPFNLCQLTRAFAEFNVSEAEQMSIYRALAGILYLGQVEFVSRDMDGHLGTSQTTVLDKKPVEAAMRLWGITTRVQEVTDELIKVLTITSIRSAQKYLSVDDSRGLLNSLCKGVYEMIFDTIVERIRTKLDVVAQSASMPEHKRHGQNEPRPNIGVLDMFGFENLRQCGFEQLLINYANEELQQYFIEQVVKNELSIYEAEGVIDKGRRAAFQASVCERAPDAALPAINLLVNAKDLTIFKLLEDACRLKTDDQHLCTQINDLIKNRGGSLKLRYDKALEFQLNHYAEPVVYMCKGFVDQNQDYMSQDLLRFVADHPFSFHADARALPRRKAKSISVTFQKEMQQMIGSLSEIQSYFIKCIKPNNEQQRYKLHRGKVNNQLITCGIIPVLNVMIRLGYPCRINTDLIFDLIKASGLDAHAGSELSSREWIELVLDYIKVDDYSLGVSKVFFKYDGYRNLEMQLIALNRTPHDRRNFMNGLATFKRVWKLERVFCAMVVLVKLRDKLCRIRLKLNYRRILTDLIYSYNNDWLPRRHEKAARVIQEWFLDRGIIRIWHLQRLRAIVMIQRVIRGVLVRRFGRGFPSAENDIEMLTVQDRAAIHIQAVIRGYLVRKRFGSIAKVHEIAAAVKLQHFLKVLLTRQWRDHRRADVRARWKAARQSHDEDEFHSPTASISRPTAGRTSAKSPVFGAIDKSTRRKPPFSHTVSRFNQTRDYWETIMNSPEGQREYLRKRRSVFAATHVTPPSRRVLKAVLDEAKDKLAVSSTTCTRRATTPSRKGATPARRYNPKSVLRTPCKSTQPLGSSLHHSARSQQPMPASQPPLQCGYVTQPLAQSRTQMSRPPSRSPPPPSTEAAMTSNEPTPMVVPRTSLGAGLFSSIKNSLMSLGTSRVSVAPASVAPPSMPPPPATEKVRPQVEERPYWPPYVEAHTDGFETARDYPSVQMVKRREEQLEVEKPQPIRSEGSSFSTSSAGNLIPRPPWATLSGQVSSSTSSPSLRDIKSVDKRGCVKEESPSSSMGIVSEVIEDELNRRLSAPRRSGRQPAVKEEHPLEEVLEEPRRDYSLGVDPRNTGLSESVLKHTYSSLAKMRVPTIPATISKRKLSAQPAENRGRASIRAWRATDDETPARATEKFALTPLFGPSRSSNPASSNAGSRQVDLHSALADLETSARPRDEDGDASSWRGEEENTWRPEQTAAVRQRQESSESRSRPRPLPVAERLQLALQQADAHHAPQIPNNTTHMRRSLQLTRGTDNVLKMRYPPTTTPLVNPGSTITRRPHRLDPPSRLTERFRSRPLSPKKRSG